jgi:MoxR-like ATPase
MFLDRDEIITGVLTALLAREHVLLLGVPGTAKSGLARALCESLAASNFFRVLFSKFTVPEEILGPVSLAGLQRDEYRRSVEGYLPEAHVSFLDEIYKANSVRF